MAPRKTKKKKATEPSRKRRRVDNAAKKSLAQRIAAHEGVIQSLELMKIALHACLATLAFARELLPEDVFGWRQFPDLPPGQKYSYDKFRRGKEMGEDVDDHPPIMMIERGVSDTADKILDLLEEGIFDALVRRRLAAVQFSVTTNKDRPDTAVETYTITMGSAGRYGNTVSLEAELDSCFDKDMANAVPIAEVEADIDTTIRHLSMLERPPALPGPRAFAVELFYTEDCPKTYKAHGFADVASNVDSDVLLFPSDKGEPWTRLKGVCALINCGFYTAVIRVSCFECSPWLMLTLHRKDCRCKNKEGDDSDDSNARWNEWSLRYEDRRCHELKPVPMPLSRSLAFEEVVLRESEFGLPKVDEGNGEEDSSYD